MKDALEKLKASVKTLENFDPKEQHNSYEIEEFNKAKKNAITALNYMMVSYHLIDEINEKDKTKVVEEESEDQKKYTACIDYLTHRLIALGYENKVLIPSYTNEDDIDKSGIWYEIIDWGGIYFLYQHNSQEKYTLQLVYTDLNNFNILEEVLLNVISSVEPDDIKITKDQILKKYRIGERL